MSTAAPSVATSSAQGHPRVDAGAPLRVRERTAATPSGPIAASTVDLVFVTAGWVTLYSSAGVEPLEAGSVLTIPATLACNEVPTGYVRTVTLHFHPDYLTDLLRWLPAQHPLVYGLCRALHGEPPKQLLRLAPAAMRSITPHLTCLSRPWNDDRGRFAMLSIASDLFDAVGRLSGATDCSIFGAGQIPRPEVTTAIALLRTNLQRPWRLEDLARAVALSPSQLVRLFGSQVGLSPAAFLRQLRSERMAEILISSSCSVGSAAAEVGWRDAAVASRAFKQRFGVTPSSYATSCCRSSEPKQRLGDLNTT